MAIMRGHTFPAHQGFTGSANPSANMRPEVPGFKHGGMEHEIAHAIHEHEDHEHGGHHTRIKLKHGGKVDGKDHYGKHGHVDHDGSMHQSHVSYDEHGFQHMAHGGKSAKHHAGHSKKHREE